MAISAGVGAAIAGGLSAVGSIAGGALSKPDQIDPKNSFYYPPSDPVLAGVSNEAMIGMGLPSPYILEQASPINQIINKINMNPGYTDDQKEVFIRGLTLAQGGLRSARDPSLPLSSSVTPKFGTQAEKEYFVKVMNNDFVQKAILASGISKDQFQSLLRQESLYQDQTARIQSQYGEIQPDIFASRLGTQQSIANLMGEVASQYGAGGQPGATVGGYMRNLETDINTTYDKQLEDVLRLSNTTGFNPGRAVSDLEDSRASALRNLGHQGTLQAEQLISLMQGSLQPAQQLASTTAATRTGQGIGASSVAGNQASVINQIQAQTNAQRAQAMGAGVAGGFNSLSDAFILQALMSQGPAGEDGPR